MKFVRFTEKLEEEIKFGIIADESIKEISGSPLEHWEYTGKSFQMQDVSLKTPIQPCHIIGIGKNFVAEGTPLPPVPEIPIFFYKPITTVVGPDAAVYLPEGTDEIKFESELAVIIGRKARNIKAEQANDYIFGYTVANDFADLNYFHQEGHWTIGKAFDTFCPLGPVMETDLDYNAIRVKATVNGILMQDSPTSLMIMPIDQMIAYISTFMTLMPGDVILTGTPAGACMVKNNDLIDCYIDEIGHLRNPIQKVSS